MRELFSIAATLLLATLALRAQTPPTSPSAEAALVVGSGNFFSPIVADLEKAVAFYRDGLGLEVTGDPSNADTNPALRDMFGLPDAKIRWQIARPAGMRTGVEIVEIRSVPNRLAARRIQDPGAFTLIVLVRDVNDALARVTQAGAPIITRGGRPVRLAPGASSAVVVRDPDGHFVELVQPDPLPDTAASAAGAVLGVRVRLTVDDVDRTLRLYRDAMGLQVNTRSDFSRGSSVLTVLGLTKGQYRLATTQVPGSGLGVEFIEFKGIDRHLVRGGIQDPGSTRMQLQVRDVDAAIAALKRAGGTVVSTGGNIVALPGRGVTTTKTAIVRDPDNLFLVLIQAQAPRS
jgi:catechol 2,3-dioxygenase-like lactoylglutathione lyase family enzyme